MVAVRVVAVELMEEEAITIITTIAGSNVTIQNFSFNSSDLHITKGATVVWTNKDNVTHTVTADDGSFTSGNIAPGGTYSRAFTAAATVHYHCSIHTYMTADIVIQ